MLSEPANCAAAPEPVSVNFIAIGFVWPFSVNWPLATYEPSAAFSIFCDSNFACGKFLRVEPVLVEQRRVAVVIARVDRLELHGADDAALGRIGSVEVDLGRERLEPAVELRALLRADETDGARLRHDGPRCWRTRSC